MTLPPPALSNPPQFDPAYWDKAPRDMQRVKLAQWRKIDHDDGKRFIEFIFDGGNAFMRNVDDIDQDVWEKVHVNSELFVQTVNKELVTGLFLPEVGWVFKMTGEDLANYSRKLTDMLHRRRQAARAELVEFVSEVISKSLTTLQQAIDVPDRYVDWIDCDELAVEVINAMASAKPAENANT